MCIQYIQSCFIHEVSFNKVIFEKTVTYNIYKFKCIRIIRILKCAYDARTQLCV